MLRLVTPAIVVRTVDYGEADRIVTLFCREAGKLSAIARGARKSTRRFGAGLSLFGTGEAKLTERPGSELATLESFDGARGFPHLTMDMVKVAHGGYACELVRELSPPRQPEPEVFDLLIELLERLDGEPARAESLRLFELRLLDLVGLRPELERCLGCGAVALDGNGQAFEGRRGGVVCGACRLEGAGQGVALSGEARQALVRMQEATLASASELTLAPAVNAACRDALSALITFHLGRPLKSVEFIAKLSGALRAL
ncbi:MAG TPA: DNA repair protein RecO [Polyangia bacterium]|jgi:DNA repair protein RecO (recombination protein O)